jgi:hypothetical protein
MMGGTSNDADVVEEGDKIRVMEEEKASKTFVARTVVMKELCKRMSE